MRKRNDYLGEVLFPLTMIHVPAIRNKLFKIYYRIQTKSIYTSELVELEKIKKEIEKEQERRWEE